MIKLSHRLEVWLQKYYAEFWPLISLGFYELITDEMWNEYVDWCYTDEGKQYLKGGS